MYCHAYPSFGLIRSVDVSENVVDFMPRDTFDDLLWSFQYMSFILHRLCLPYLILSPIRVFFTSRRSFHEMPQHYIGISILGLIRQCILEADT